MIKNLNLQVVTNTGEAREYRASLLDGKWYGKKLLKWYPIHIPVNMCDKLEYIFSSKANDYWEEGTLKKHTKLNRVGYVDRGFWTPFRQGLRFRGTLMNGIIYVDWKHHQAMLKKEHGKARDIFPKG